MLVFEESGKPEYPEKNLSSTPTYGVDAGIRTRATLVGGDSPLRHPCSTVYINDICAHCHCLSQPTSLYSKIIIRDDGHPIHFADVDVIGQLHDDDI